MCMTTAWCVWPPCALCGMVLPARSSCCSASCSLVHGVWSPGTVLCQRLASRAGPPQTGGHTTMFLQWLCSRCVNRQCVLHVYISAAELMLSCMCHWWLPPCARIEGLQSTRILSTCALAERQSVKRWYGHMHVAFMPVTAAAGTCCTCVVLPPQRSSRSCAIYSKALLVRASGMPVRACILCCGCRTAGCCLSGKALFSAAVELCSTIAHCFSARLVFTAHQWALFRAHQLSSLRVLDELCGCVGCD
jgi:hypothetical protein